MKIKYILSLKFLIAVYSFYANCFTQNTIVSLIGQIPDGSCRAISIRDNFAFIGNGSAFDIIDISNPYEPKLIGRSILKESVKRIYLNNKYAFVALKTEGFNVIDISQINSPSIVNHVITDNTVNDIFIYGDYLYLAQNREGLDIYDIQDPAFPKKVNHVDSVGICIAIDMWNNHLFVACHTDSFLYIVPPYSRIAYKFNGFRIFDLSNPELPIEIGKYQNQSWDPLIHSIEDIAVQNDYIYIASINFGVGIINVHDMESPQAIARIQGHAKRIYLYNNYVYSFDHNFINITKVDDPENPSNTLQINILDDKDKFGEDFYVTENNIFVACRNGFLIYDAANKESPKKMNFYGTGGYVRDVWIEDENAFILHSSNQLNIYDINNHSSPDLICSFKIPWEGDDYDMLPNRLFLSGNYLYIACAGAGIHIIDISNPNSPFEIGNFLGSFVSLNLWVENNLAYIADFTNGLIIVDISNPKNPMEINFLKLNNAYYADIHKYNNYIYLSNNNKVNIIDVTDPRLAHEIVIYNSGDNIENIFVNNNYIYALIYSHGLEVVDVHNPSNPILVSHCYWQEPGESSEDIFVYDDFAFIADYGGLRIMDVKNHLNPNEIGFYSIPNDFTSAVHIVKDIIYVAALENGVYILKNNLMSGIYSINENTYQDYHLYQNYPNPFNSETTIKYNLLKKGNITISIFNMAGQEIETIYNNFQTAGIHQIKWQSKGLPCGIYFYRLHASAFCETKKILLLN